MARNFKNRPAHIRPSVYLIHTRLLAQGLVVGESVPEVIVDSYQHHGDSVIFKVCALLECSIKCIKEPLGKRNRVKRNI